MKIYNIKKNKINNKTFLANCVEEYDVFLLKYD